MSRVPSVNLGHVGLNVRDLERMERFYVGFLGMIVTDRGDIGNVRLVFLSRDAREHHQMVLVSGLVQNPDGSVLNQISMRVPDLAALRHFAGTAEAYGGHDVRPITHGNAISVYLRDPEGNRLEFYLDTPWYVPQPQRAPVDLAKPDAVVWQEVEAFARAQPGFRPVEEWRKELASRIANA